MRKIVVAVLTMALLTITFAALPVMAEPQGQKVPVTLTLKPLTTQVSAEGDRSYTPGGVFHVSGRVETVSVVIKIGVTTYNGFLVMTEHGIWNPQEKVMSINTDEILYIPSTGSANGFAGNGRLRFYNYVWSTPPSWTDQTVFRLWQGFGSFEGQTILLSYDGPKGLVPVTGWCLKG